MWCKCAARPRSTALNKDSVQEVPSTQGLEMQSLSPASPALLTPTLCGLIFGCYCEWLQVSREWGRKKNKISWILNKCPHDTWKLWNWIWHADSGLRVIWVFSPWFKTTIFFFKNKHLIYRICQMKEQLCLKENIWLGFGFLLTSLGTNPIGKMALIHDLYCPDLQWEFNFWFDFG